MASANDRPDWHVHPAGRQRLRDVVEELGKRVDLGPSTRPSSNLGGACGRLIRIGPTKPRLSPGKGIG